MASEKRLIHESERADLIRCLKKIHDLDFTPGVYEHSVIGRAALFLEETADAVEVVRCKDCKWWSENDSIFCTATKECRCGYWKGLFDYCKPDDFCSYGERRTEG